MVQYHKQDAYHLKQLLPFKPDEEDIPMKIIYGTLEEAPLEEFPMLLLDA